MIPYFTFVSFGVGPVRIQVWGLFVALGILTASFVGRREAKRRGLDADRFLDLATWTIIAALVGGRLMHVFAYEPAAYLAAPWRILKFWEGGLSMTGGLLFGALTVLLYSRRHQLPFLAYADVAAFVLPLGDGIGRLGCFLIHDHPGVASDLFLAVRFPGGPALDHGLLLSLLGFLMFGLFLSLAHFRPTVRQGGFLPLYLVIYGAARFLLDFYRTWAPGLADTRYFFLTPAQYGSLIMIAIGFWLAVARRERPTAVTR